MQVSSNNSFTIFFSWRFINAPAIFHERRCAQKMASKVVESIIKCGKPPGGSIELRAFEPAAGLISDVVRRINKIV
jgi:hypothetical protein